MAHKIDIDRDVLRIAGNYVELQLATMKAYGSEVILAKNEYYDLVYNCAEPIQIIRNFKKKANRAG